ncbi:MAG TPA: hypothetical protein VMY35_08915 [Phycisphaerae bacterium]|nr:hypothetical protein [Phycisphaerae bacterium]
MTKKTLIGFVFVLAVSLTMFGCFMEDGTLRLGWPVATSQPADTSGATKPPPGTADEVIGDSMMVLGTLLGCPPLVIAGYMVGKLKVTKILTRVVENVQEGRNAVKTVAPKALKAFDNAARAASDATVDAVVKKIKKKSLIDPVTEK